MYKVLTIVASDAEVILEDVENIEEAEIRLKELNETNENFLDMQSYVIILDGDVIKHNFKNINKF
jgi:hypothetical protein